MDVSSTMMVGDTVLVGDGFGVPLTSKSGPFGSTGSTVLGTSWDGRTLVFVVEVSRRCG